MWKMVVVIIDFWNPCWGKTMFLAGFRGVWGAYQLGQAGKPAQTS